MKNRNVELDKLKVLAMIGIVMIHQIYHSQIIDNMERYTWEWCILSIMYSIGFAMTNVFVLVSSHLLIDNYLIYKKNINEKKIIKMLLLTSGYSTLIYIILVVFNVTSFSIVTLAESILSVFTNQYWFIGTYLILYSISPFLTKMLNVLEEKELRVFIIIGLSIFSILPTIMIFIPAQNLYDANNGKSILWFLNIFMLVFYFKKYKVEWYEKTSKSKLYLGIVVNCIILVVSKMILFKISNLIGLCGDGESRLYFDSSLFVFMISVFIYLLAIKKKTNQSLKYDKWWGYCSSSTLSVYLIHNHPVLRTYLWEWCMFHFKDDLKSIFNVMIITLSVFCICLFIDIVRRSMYSCILYVKNRREFINECVTKKRV